MKHRIILLSLCIFIFACGKKDETPAGGTTAAADSTEEKNEAKARQVYDILSSNNLDGLDAHIDANYTEHTPWPGQEPGLSGLKKGFTEFRTAFPDMKIEADHVWADDDFVIIHFRQTGTMTGPLMGMPPTNKKMDITGVDIVRIKDGKATDHWGYQEDNKMAQQMGWAPEMGAAPEQPAPGGAPKKPAQPSGSPKKEAPSGSPKY